MTEAPSRPVRRKRSEVTSIGEGHIGPDGGYINVPADTPVTVYMSSDGKPEGLDKLTAGLMPSSPPISIEVPLFQSVNAAKEPALPKSFFNIVESWQSIDVEATYKRLRDGLKLGVDGRNDKGRLREALDNAEDNAREAHLLYCLASIEKERYDIDAQPVFGAMWNSAVEILEGEAADAEEEAVALKEKGRRKPPKKNITNEDVKSKAAAMYPDQWRRHHVGQEKVKALVLHMKELSDLWAQRCRSLEVLLGGAR